MGLSELLFWSFVGGLVGSLFMDIASSGLQKLSGGSAALIDRWELVGRWCLGMFDGRELAVDRANESAAALRRARAGDGYAQDHVRDLLHARERLPLAGTAQVLPSALDGVRKLLGLAPLQHARPHPSGAAHGVPRTRGPRGVRDRR